IHRWDRLLPLVAKRCGVLDTLVMARQMHPGQRNSLDALCKRYEVDATRRDVHGALIDSELLANVYLAMTGGQTMMLLDDDVLGHHADSDKVGVTLSRTLAEEAESRPGVVPAKQGRSTASDLSVIKANKEEITAHDAILEKIRKSGACVWDIE
ncbi:MAG: exonuclease domain-containing protein, partial [Woeseiaceae bacterium]|nr:exonuclease domain-containing protein [Woeseiaceae bacterium]